MTTRNLEYARKFECLKMEKPKTRDLREYLPRGYSSLIKGDEWTTEQIKNHARGKVTYHELYVKLLDLAIAECDARMQVRERIQKLDDLVGEENKDNSTPPVGTNS